MDIAPIVSELKRERDRLSRAIAALERTAVAGTDLEKRAARALFVRGLVRPSQKSFRQLRNN